MSSDLEKDMGSEEEPKQPKEQLWLNELPGVEDSKNQISHGTPNSEKMFCNESSDDVAVVLGHKNHIAHGQLMTKDAIPFLDMVHEVVGKKSNVPFATWYDSKGHATTEYTFGKLWEEAGVISYYLRKKWGANKGDRVVLCYDFGLHFFASFIGCLRAGVTAVVVYPPFPPLTTSLGKMMNVVDDCSPMLVLTDSKVNLMRMADTRNPFSRSKNLWPKNVSWRVTEKLISNKVSRSFDEEALTADDMAFLQYTSGSTGDPKGVMISFSALSTNVKLFHNAFYKAFEDDGGMPSEVAGFTWLPQYHDLGLIYALMTPFAAGWRMHAMSPITFMQNPLLWLELMSRLRVTFGVAPDFAYHLVVRRFEEAREKAGGQNPIPGLDLGSLCALQNCAESIQLSTHEKFSKVFSKYNLRDNWFGAGYGLAENVVGVSWLHCHHQSIPRDKNESPIVASGVRKNFDPSLTLKIVDPDTSQVVDDETTGEIWITGGSKAKGYFNKPQLTQEVFHATINGDTSGQTYLRTGDLAFFQQDYLFICGRIKDLIICNGVNYYPQDIECVVQDVSPGVRPGCVAAFSREESGSDGELEIVFEIRKARASEAAAVCQEVRRAVIQRIGLSPSRVVAIPERTICKTTSGKIQRKANRTKLHCGDHRIVFELSNDTANHHTSFHNSNESGGAEDNRNGGMTLNTIMIRFFGSDYDPNENWEELGLSSMVAVELRQSISENFAVSLPADVFEQQRSPSCLESFIAQTAGTSLPVKLSDLDCRKTISVSWLTMSVIQAIGVVFLLVIFSSSIIPAYYVGQLVAKSGSPAAVLPFVIPTFMLSFSLVVIVIKWAVIWRYQEQEMRSQTTAFIRWWFVDRAVDIWEKWVGQFIKGTPLLCIFYRLMGANIHPAVLLDSFVREFDLVTVEKGVTLDHHIRCRRFGPWNDETGPTLRFRRVSIGKFCSVHGMLCPGVSLGEGSYVDHLSVVPEGAQVENGILVSGNPAFNAGSAPEPSTCSWIKLGIIKLLWLFAELYIFSAFAMVAQIWLRDLHNSGWRYARLLFWFSLVAIYSVLALILVIILKWTLIGRRRPGQKTSTLRTAADWIVDYHFRVSILTLFPVSFNSRIWNGFLMLLGMDIDFESKIYVDNLPPSQADLISVTRSFVANANFDTKSDGCYQSTSVSDSSVGIFVYTDPNVRISRAIIEPCSHVTTDVVRDHLDERAIPSSQPQMLWLEMAIGILYTLQLPLIFASLIPVYELWESALKPPSVELAVFVLSLALAAQTLVWVFYLAALQLVAYTWTTKRKAPWNAPIYMVMMSTAYAVQEVSFLSTFWGTPMFNAVARFLGASIEGRMLFFGARIYEWPYVTFADKTVLDSAIATGHIVVYGDITLGPCRVAGVLHEGAHAFANTVVTEKESGPWKALFNSQQDVDFSCDVEAPTVNENGRK